MATLETIPCVCFGKDGVARIDCGICHGTGARPMLGYGYLWPNGTWNDEVPPAVIARTSPALEVLESPPPKTFEMQDGEIHLDLERITLLPKPPPKAPSHKLPAVDPTWEPTQRSYLRERALDFAIRAAGALLSKPVTGDELLDSAEYIERWLAQGDINERKLGEDSIGHRDRGEVAGEQHPEPNTAGGLPSDSNGGAEASPKQTAEPDRDATI